MHNLQDILSNYYVIASVASFTIGFLATITLKLQRKKRPKKEEEDKIIKSFQPEPLFTNNVESNSMLNPLIVNSKVGLYVNINGINCLNFGSHNYLGFIGNEEIENKAIECISQCGVGTCGPPLFYGTNVKHLDFEKALSEFFGSERAIIYPQSFATVASAIPVYVKKRDIVFADKKVNFAIQSGIVASRSEVVFFKHNDVQDLEKLLEDYKDILRARKARGFLIIEGTYINSGQICPLPKLVALANKYKLRIFIDETISFCTLGRTGKGVTEHFGVPQQEIDLIMGSFENALSSGGGFCVGSRFLIEHQVLCGQGHIFSAALPPLLVTAAAEAFKQIQEHPDKLERLKRVCKTMHKKLSSSIIINECFSVSGDEESPIHVLTLKTYLWKCHNEQNIKVKDIFNYCLTEQLAVANVGFLQEVDSSVEMPGLRLISNIFHTEEHITRCISILEQSCVKFCQLKKKTK